MPPTVPPVSRVLFRFISGTSGSGSVCAYAFTNVAIDMPPVVTGSMLGGYRRGISPITIIAHRKVVLHHLPTADFESKTPKYQVFGGDPNRLMLDRRGHLVLYTYTWSCVFFSFYFLVP